MNTFNKEDAILEYEEEENILVTKGQNIYLKADKNRWLFPNFPTDIKIGLHLRIPDDCVALLVKSVYLDTNIQLDTRIIHDDQKISYLRIMHRGLFPTKISKHEIIAELIIIPKVECHIINSKGQA